HGQLSGFVSAISAAMGRAQTIVASAVSSIVASLSSLNRTFQGPTIRVTTVKETKEVKTQGFAPHPPTAPMVMTMPMADGPLAFATAADVGSVTTQTEALSSFANAMARKKEEAAESGVTKIYNV